MTPAFPITSRANRRRAPSLDNATSPLLPSIPQRRSVRQQRDEEEKRDRRRNAVNRKQCLAMYAILAVLYGAVMTTVYIARRPGAFVSQLPDMVAGDTLPGEFNPYTAWEHLKAITTTPHPFNSRANTDITKAYILDQFRKLQAEAIAYGRRNVRYDDRVDNSTWTQLYKTHQQRRMEDAGESEPSDGEPLREELLTVVQGDNLLMWVGGVVDSMEGDVPVKIEIDVDQESQTALMISAHYDSVPTSYGETDDGGGVSVALAMIRHFIHHPVQHTLIFNINNAEEQGSYGAAAFMGASLNSTLETGMGHPWKKYVKAFVNLEGGGSGGPSLLFRATDSDIIRYYAESAPFPHASVFSNDVFQLNLIQSDTDYSVFLKHGLPGLDIAFYQRRSMYHTTTDYLPIESLYHMGLNTQETITSLCNSNYLDIVSPAADIRKESSPLVSRPWFAGKSVFYDVLGTNMVFSELWAALLINALGLGLGLPLLAVTIIYAGRALHSRQRNNPRTPPQNRTQHSLRSAMDSGSQSTIGYSEDGYGSVHIRPSQVRLHSDASDKVRQTLSKKTTVAWTTGLVALIVALDLGAVFAASRWLLQTNSMTLAVCVCTWIEERVYGPVPIVRGASQWTLALGVWWWIIAIVVGAGVAGWFGMGAFYGTTVLALFSGGAALIQVILSLLSPDDGLDLARFGWTTVVAGISLLVPGVIVLDLVVLVVYMTSQSIVDNDLGIMYTIYGVLLIPIVLPALPVISQGRNFKTVLITEILILMPLVWWLSQADPFTADAPAGLYFTQYYNQTARSSYVELRTDAGPGYLERIVQGIPDIRPTNLMALTAFNGTCIPTPTDEGGMFAEYCRFLPARQVFEDDGWDRPVHVNWTSPSRRRPDGWREGRLQILALESRHCSIHLAETAPGYETQLLVASEEVGGQSQIGAKDGNVLNHRPKTLDVFLRDWNRSWEVIVRVREPNLNSSDHGRDVRQGGGKTVPLKVVCEYDDWSSGEGYAEVYNFVRTHIPEWIRMKIDRRLIDVGVGMEV
ncbi:hypothetical protein BGZ54_009099 [Gamsiella multidivaricata]|nr:hypothetical protein BGZ54_009099 [Gamsiella multidivaricata]